MSAAVVDGNGNTERVSFCQSGRNTHPKGITVVLCFSVFGTLWGTSFMIGYNSGVVNNAGSVLKQFFSDVKLNRTGFAFTSWELTWFWSACVGALPVLAPIGCYIGSWSAKKIGRKKTLMVNAAFLFLSGLLQALSKPVKSYELFFLGRLVIGLQIGIGSTAAPMYISEISPINYRGSFSALFDWFYTLGVGASAVFGFESLFGNEPYWPQLFTVLLLCALIQITVLHFCPESPRFLLIDNKDSHAASLSLKSLRGKRFNIEEEMQQMSKEFEATKNLPEISYRDYFKRPELRNPLILALVAAFCNQFSGIAAINLFSEPILAAVLSSYGIAQSNYSKYLVALLSVTGLVVSIFSVILVDKVGRRKCALFSLTGLFICNTSLAVLLSDVTTAGQLCNGVPVGKTGKVMALFFIFAHAVSYSSGVSSLTWIITPELFLTNARPKATFMTTSIYWAALFTISMGFEVLEKTICGWVFLIFSLLLLIFFIYFWFKLPLLDGKPTNEIASYFEKENHAKISKNNSSGTVENQDTQEWSPLLR